MCLLRKPSISSYWSSKGCDVTPWFSQIIPRNRFQLILKFFHLIDNRTLGQQAQDPTARFEPLLTHANRLFRRYYVPNPEVSIDESLVWY